MNTLPLQFLIRAVAAWLNRGQQDVIEYLQEENRTLREQIGDRRPRFTDEQRRRLSPKARCLSRRSLNDLGPLVTPDTLLRWYLSLDYHLERNHQGLGNELIEPSDAAGRGRVACRERPGGLLRCYDRRAA